MPMFTIRLYLASTYGFQAKETTLEKGK